MCRCVLPACLTGGPDAGMRVARVPACARARPHPGGSMPLWKTQATKYPIGMITTIRPDA